MVCGFYSNGCEPCSGRSASTEWQPEPPLLYEVLPVSTFQQPGLSGENHLRPGGPLGLDQGIGQERAD